ncbi:MAG: magnesium/cobalt transporter CorA [Phycisphaerae bacterium]
MVNKIFRKRHTKAGARPGTLVMHPEAQPVSLRAFVYDAESLEEPVVAGVQDVPKLLAGGRKVWLDINGLGSEDVLRKLGEIFHIHPLALEDVVNLPQRPKVEAYDEHLLIITRMVRAEGEMKIDYEQVSLLLGKNYVVTFQERCGDVFDPVRERLRRGGGPIRKLGPDYLAYALLDAVIDGYYPVLEKLGDALEDLETEIVAQPHPANLRTIHRAKRELLAVRRGIWPQREKLNTMIRDDSAYITDEVRVYLRDCYDHCVQIMDAVESYRELASGLMDVYISSVGFRQNEIMKVLTIMASIFIPLTFLVGIYGMNFEHMPELHAKWGYPILIAVMAMVATVMLVYFKRRGWIQSDVPATFEEED